MEQEPMIGSLIGSSLRGGRVGGSFLGRCRLSFVCTPTGVLLLATTAASLGGLSVVLHRAGGTTEPASGQQQAEMGKPVGCWYVVHHLIRFSTSQIAVTVPSAPPSFPLLHSLLM